MKPQIDVVYTWVDDSQPGYLDMLRKHAGADIDLNPNRTRDNLDLIKYSLRSLEQFVDWHGDVYIFSCRPQQPDWVKPGIEKLHIIHHDEVIDSRYLPTFNSFCIISHLAELHEVSDPFLYLEDDMLFASTTTMNDFMQDDGRLVLYPQLERTTPAHKQHDQCQPPWNKALSYSNSLLDRRYGPRARHAIDHVPILVYKQYWREMTETWHEAFEHTRHCKFRELYNVAPEYLYLYFMFHENRAEMGSILDTWRKTFYIGLGNLTIPARFSLFVLDKLHPLFYCMNDNFGEKPNPRVVNMVRNYLEETYPDKSSFEL